MSDAAKNTLCKLVEDHISNLIRESISVQRHTKRARFHQTMGGGGGGSTTEEHTSSSGGNNSSSSVIGIGIGGGGGGVPTSSSGSSSRRRQQQQQPHLRRMLQADDINLALQWCGGGEKMLTTNAGGVIKSRDKVDLSAYVRSELKHKPPSEIGMTVHWLAVSGVQPKIPQNPIEMIPRTRKHHHLVHRIENDHDDDDDDEPNPTSSNNDTPSSNNNNNNNNNNNAAAVSVRQLLPRVLAEELRLYFTRVTLAIERGTIQQQDDAVQSVARDSGTQELVPFFFRFVARQIYDNIGRAHYCLLLVRLAYALVSNPHLHPELHLHQIVPSLMSCVVARRLGFGALYEDHWALRYESARTLVKLCSVFGNQYPNLKPRLIVELCNAIGPDKGLSTQYGGMVAISLFGPKAVDSFVLPIVATYWRKWERVLEIEKTNLSKRFEVQRCQDALLHALAVFFSGSDPVEQSEAMDYDSMSEVFGEQLLPLMGDQDKHEYFACFI